jgi:glycosyltransferase involved in cell wall biosynthesis
MPPPTAYNVLRVALVSPPLDASGGTGRLMSSVIARLDANQVRVRHIDSRGRRLRPVLSIFPMVRSCLELVRLKASRRVDLVHINLSYRGSTIRKCTIARLSHLMRIPTVLHLHACEYEEFFAKLPPIFKHLVSTTFRQADHVIVLGQIWEKFLLKELGVSQERITVLYNAASGPSDLELRQSRPDGAKVRLLFLGKLGARKGVPELLQALSRIQQLAVPWSVTMAGDGDIQGARKSALEFGILDRVTFTGWLDPVQVRGLLESHDVLILPSHAEGSPMVIVEAFAYGVAVISTPVGAIPEVVTDCENGLLVPVRDIDALEKAIVTLCQDKDLREGLALGGRHAWETRFDIAPYVERLVTLWFGTTASL